MHERDWLFRIVHMIEFAEKSTSYVTDETFEEFAKHRMLYDSVCRNLELLGEASAHVPGHIKAKYPDIPWIEIRGLRNILAHEYMGADDEIIWRTATKLRTGLIQQLTALKSAEG